MEIQPTSLECTFSITTLPGADLGHRGGELVPRDVRRRRALLRACHGRALHEGHSGQVLDRDQIMTDFQGDCA